MGALIKLDIASRALRGSRMSGADKGLRWHAGGVGVRKEQVGREGESGSRKEVERPGVVGWDCGPRGGPHA